MFLQFMHGKVRDRSVIEEQMDLWRREYRDGATGFLGSTSGFTDDGHFIALARFASEEAANDNAHRPEQNAWWEKFAGGFDGDVSFIDCPEVDLLLGGGSDQAGFVQVMRGKAVDADSMRASADEMEKEMAEVRPDVLGFVCGWHGDGEFVQAVYFNSEEEARKGEAESQDDPRAAEWDDMFDGPITFIDLHDPRFD